MTFFYVDTISKTSPLLLFTDFYVDISIMTYILALITTLKQITNF